MVAHHCRVIKRWQRNVVMDVLLSVRKTCFCCGAQGTQPIYAEAARSADATAALDGSLVAGRLNRGMQICEGCGYCAPALDAAPRGLGVGEVRTALAASSYGGAMRRRGAADARHANATRWLAYATAFEGVLTPEQAGFAWVNAAAELEQPRLHPLGSAEGDSQPDEEGAHLARVKAISHLASVFEAEFGAAGSGSRLSGLRRALRRWNLGERAVRSARWSASEHVVADTSADMRFELACTLTDLLRRTGEFVAARTVALRALHDADVPYHLGVTLSFQLRLCHETTTELFHCGDLVDTIVAFPTRQAVEHCPDQAAEDQGAPLLGGLVAAAA